MSEVDAIAERMLRLIGTHGHVRPARPTGFAVGDTALPLEHLQILLARDWLASDGAGFTLSAAGRAALKRRLAGADSFRAQHQARASATVEIGGQVQPALLDEGESPLGWLRRRKDKSGRPLIDAAQFAAGERLRADFTRGGLQPRVTASWDPTRTMSRSRQAAGAGGPGDAALAARERLRRALRVVGPELATVLLDVCCFERGLEAAETEAGWPQRSGKVVLLIALSALARHYGLVGEAEAALPIERRLRHWGTADYRPAIEG